jgi:RluA family pseudouridine synthase
MPWDLQLTVRLSSKVQEPIRLMTYLKAISGCSSIHIKGLLHRGLCTVNAEKERFGSRMLSPGDTVMLEVQEAPVPIPFEKGRILFENEELLAYDKPPFISSLDVEKMLHAYNKKLQLLHRLDKETSGVLLLAKKDPKPYLALFKKRKVAKGYVAIVDGIIKEDEGVIDKPLMPLSRYEGQVVMGVSPEGLPAITRYLVKKRYKKATLVACFPVTGRTHQIRVHMQWLGHPILGDHHYAKKCAAEIRPKRILLHAALLKINDITIKAPLPEDFRE